MNIFLKQLLAKDTYYLWFISIMLPALAVLIDSAYLKYFDIPATYSEINLYIVLYAVTFIVLTIFALSTAVMLVQSIAESKYLLLRVLVQPFPFFTALIAVVIILLTHESFNLALWFYLVAIILSLLASYFDSPKNLSFFAKVKQYDFAYKPIQIINTPSGRMYEKTATFASLLLIVFFIMLCTNYVTSFLNFTVLRSSPNTIAIKRNNNLYILKRYNPATNILEKGYRLTTVDREDLELIELDSPGELKAASSIEYSIKMKQQQEEKIKRDSVFISNAIQNIKNTYESIANWSDGLLAYFHAKFEEPEPTKEPAKPPKSHSLGL